MGLGDFINRYIVEVRPSGGAAPKATDPPEVRARGVEVVPGKRPVQDVIADVEARLGRIDPAVLEEAEAAEARVAPKPPPPSQPAPSQPAATQPRPSERLAIPKLVSAPTRDPLDDGGDPPVGIDQVYAASKIGKPAHGFTLEKIAGMLADPRLAALDPQARAGAIAVVLEAQGVKIEEVVQDAATRDAALDKFEAFLTDKLVSLQVEVDEDRRRMEAEIERLIQKKQEELARLSERVENKERELARFRRVKREEERRLFEVVRAFTAENPITVTPVADGAAPPPTDESVSGKLDTGRFPRSTT